VACCTGYGGKWLSASHTSWRNRENLFDLAAMLQAGRGSIPGRGNIYIFSTASRQDLGPNQPLIEWVLGEGGLFFLEVKRSVHVADNSPPSLQQGLVLRFFALTPLVNLHHFLICALSFSALTPLGWFICIYFSIFFLSKHPFLMTF
jgi:hypothetical protein